MLIKFARGNSRLVSMRGCQFGWREAGGMEERGIVGRRGGAPTDKKLQVRRRLLVVHLFSDPVNNH